MLFNSCQSGEADDVGVFNVQHDVAPQEREHIVSYTEGVPSFVLKCVRSWLSGAEMRSSISSVPSSVDMPVGGADGASVLR